jgi:signal transduction histidine kinase
LVRAGAGADDFYGVPFALVAVVVATWLGGLGLGLIVSALSALLLSVVLPEARVIDADAESLWHVFVFSLAAALVSGVQARNRQLAERLRLETAAKDAFLTLVAHELRTPATMIFSGLKVLSPRWRQLPEKDVDDVLAAAEAEADRLASMIDDILLLSRIRNGRNGDLEPVRVSEILRLAVERFHQRHPAREVRLETPDQSLAAVADQRNLLAVLRNLLVNSDSYSPPDSAIIVSAARLKDDAVITVRDNGRSLQRDELRQIFESYYRGRNVPAGSRGLGLGLTFCKRTIEAMGGHVSASASRDGGMTVSVVLPASSS